MNKCIHAIVLWALASAIVILFQAMVGRHDVDDAKFIALAKSYNQICHFNDGEGTLVAPQWIVTAGHVGVLYHNTKDEKKKVVIICDKKYFIEKVIFHPDFKNAGEGGPIQNDIALVKINGPVEDVIPVKLYSSEDEIGKVITLVGAGDIGTGLTGPVSNDHITRGVTNIIDRVEPTWLTFDFDLPGSKDATPLEGVSGPGDSGGPAFCKIKDVVYIIGVSSHQAINCDDNGKCSEAGKYGIVEYYTRVSTYRNWILKTIKAAS